MDQNSEQLHGRRRSVAQPPRQHFCSTFDIYDSGGKA